MSPTPLLAPAKLGVCEDKEYEWNNARSTKAKVAFGCGHLVVLPRFANGQAR